MLFREITLHDYKRPMRERLESRKYCGPYKWTPSLPGKGRAFYQSSKKLACDRNGSTFDLRLEYANDHLDDHGYGSLSRINGYYYDRFEDETLVPIIARLPHGRGFLAGYTAGGGMFAGIAPEVYTDLEDACRAAHSEAEHWAEKNRESSEESEETEEDESEEDESEDLEEL
jgi:hypothetical protein